MSQHSSAAALWLALLPVALTVLELAPREVDPCRQSGSSALVRRACTHGARAVDGPARLLFGGRLDANRAAAADLELLPGLGPARAAAIVRARAERPFRRLEDLERVNGIGHRTVESLRGWLEVAPAGPGLVSGPALADRETTPQASRRERGASSAPGSRER